MSKGRFPSHSQHPLTACVPCTVKLCCWDTPPTTGGRVTHSARPKGAHTGNTLSCKEEEAHTHATGVMHSGCVGTGHCDK